MTHDDASSDPRLGLSLDALSGAQSPAYPTVASQFARRDHGGLMMGGSVALLLGAATLFAMSGSRTAPVQSVPPPVTVPTAPAMTTLAPVPPASQPLAAAPPPSVPLTPPAAVPVAVNPAIAIAATAERTRAPALIVDNGPAPNAAPPATAAATDPAAKAARPSLSSEEQFAQRLGGEAATVSATRMTNPASTIAQGTLMSAVLETAIDSDLPGYVRAVISRDVKSYDGSHVLVPRGSHVIGQYKSELAVGQTRAYVLWTRLLRADGVSIALGSPATDSSGRNGLGGTVNSHFGKRFSSAILLSVIGAAGQAIAGNSTVIVAGPQQALSTSAQRDLDIPPTVRVAQGAPIKIFTARDLDFSEVTR
jgi:type IV secretion system protein VirB10